VCRYVGSWGDADDMGQQTYVDFFHKGLLGERGPEVIDNVRAYLSKTIAVRACGRVRQRRVRNRFSEGAGHYVGWQCL
jgi:hypothetical protein